MLKEIIISLPLILSSNLIPEVSTDSPTIIDHNGTRVVAEESYDNITTVIATVYKHDNENNGLYAANIYQPEDRMIYIREELKSDISIGDKVKVTFENDDAVKVIKLD
ncbi:hypothetical protein [Oceanobacillus oncorhynchi]|uniref:hypothetical protein n=1 Tax=Oceanobacillus oncorhynchi TaxID=545501 RepID=UPI0034D41777